jgi:hypothetical protein
VVSPREWGCAGAQLGKFTKLRTFLLKNVSKSIDGDSCAWYSGLAGAFERKPTVLNLELSQTLISRLFYLSESA